MDVAVTLVGRQWEHCASPGCTAARVEPAGRCLTHLDGAELDAWLASIGHGEPLDARGALVDANLLTRVIAALPRNDEGHPCLRRARFDAAVFTAGASFASVVFEHEVCFDRATFQDSLSFAGARFDGHARFARTRFGADATFAGARFGAQAWFAAAVFSSDTSFEGVTFQGPAWFGGAAFEADVSFGAARFGADASFDQSKFGCHTLFPDVIFLGEARFDEASFAHEARYDGATFRGPSGAPPGAARQMSWSGEALARWPRRAAAALLDAAIPLTMVVAAAVIARLLETLQYHGMLPTLVALAAAAGFGFSLRDVAEQGRTGQTVGKRRLGLGLVRVRDGLPVGRGRGVVRQFLHVVDLAPAGIGFLWPLWDRRRQTFADKILATVVIVSSGWDRRTPAMCSDGPSGFS